ncbi:MAG: FecR domain-containing protein, partial [Magnetococcales bacterium]|nr:FecR domain-containing protein [Magnetococcales bacterium]
MKNSLSIFINTCAGLLFILIFIIGGSVMAADNPDFQYVGRLSVIQKNVQLLKSGNKTTPAVNDKVFVGQTLITAEASKAVITFRDGATFVVGPNSEIELDEFLFNPAESKTVNNINVVAGAFQYNSGFAVKNQSFVMRTPAAVLGVRGTAFEGVVAKNVPVFLNLSDGKGLLSNKAGNLQMKEGEAIAFGDNKTLPPNPDKFPAALSLQGLDYIKNEIGDEDLIPTPLTEEQAHEDALTNRMPTIKQQQGGSSKGKSGSKKNSTLLIDDIYFKLANSRRWLGDQNFVISSAFAAAKDSLSMLVEANNLKMFDKKVAVTPAMNNFISQANSRFPNAEATLKTHSNTQKTKTTANRQTSTKSVITGSAKVSESNKEMAQIVGAAVGASTDVATVAIQGALSAPGKTDNAGSASMISAAVAQAAPQEAANAASTAVNAMPASEKVAASTQIASATASVAPQAAAAVAASVTAAVGEGGSAANIAATVTQVVGESAADIAAAVTKVAGADSAAGIAASVTKVAGADAAAGIAASVTKQAGAGAAAGIAASVTKVAGAGAAAGIAASVTKEAGAESAAGIAASVTKVAGAGSAAGIAASVTKEAGAGSAAGIAASVTQVAGSGVAADIAASVTKEAGAGSAAGIAASVTKVAGANSAAAIAASVTKEAGAGSAGAISGAVSATIGQEAAANLNIQGAVAKSAGITVEDVATASAAATTEISAAMETSTVANQTATKSGETANQSGETANKSGETANTAATT